MNIPNKISITRIALMPIFIFFYLADFIPWNKFIALILFVIACVSDAVDGYIARHYNMVTDLGKFLDPIADKLLATTGLVLLIVYQIIPSPFGVIFMFVMLLRDYMVTGLRQIAQLKGVIIAADKWAKIKANFLYVTLIAGLFLAFLKDIINNEIFILVFSIIFYIFVGITTVLIIISGTVYLVNNKQVFLETKKEK